MGGAKLAPPNYRSSGTIAFAMRFLNWIDKISEYSGKIVSFLVLLMIGIVTYEVVARYVFNSPTLWAHETAQYIFGSFTILGGAYVLLRESHVRMDIIYSRVSPRTQAILDIITAPLFFAFIGVLLWKGGQIAWSSIELLEKSNSQWRPPIYPVKAMIPLAAFLILIQGIARLIRNIQRAIQRSSVT